MREDLLRYFIKSLVCVLRHARKLALGDVDMGLFGECAGLVYGVFGLLVPRPKKSPHLGGDGYPSPLIVDVGVGQGTTYLGLITHRHVVDTIAEHGAID